jgi:hypothetical protein
MEQDVEGRLQWVRSAAWSGVGMKLRVGWKRAEPS